MYDVHHNILQMTISSQLLPKNVNNLLITHITQQGAQLSTLQLKMSI